MKATVTQPRIVAFEVTRGCLYHCLHCRAEASPKSVSEELTPDKCKQILQGLAHYRKCIVILTGDEPMEKGG